MYLYTIFREKITKHENSKSCNLEPAWSGIQVEFYTNPVRISVFFLLFWSSSTLYFNELKCFNRIPIYTSNSFWFLPQPVLNSNQAHFTAFNKSPWTSSLLLCSCDAFGLKVSLLCHHSSNSCAILKVQIKSCLPHPVFFFTRS